MAGKTPYIFLEFIEYICNDIETNPLTASYIDDDCKFLWDNSCVHMAPIVVQTVKICPPGSDITFFIYITAPISTKVWFY